MRSNGQGGVVCPLRGQSLESRLAAQRGVRRTFQRMSDLRDSWSRAVAYLKARLPDDGHPPDLQISHEDSPVLRDLGNGFVVAYVVDEGGQFRYVQNRDLIQSGATEEDLHQTGIDNLYILAEQHLRVQIYGSIFAVFMEGNFEASVLLLDTVWEASLSEHVRGGFVAAAPARDVLAFGDVSSPHAIAELRAVVDRLVRSGADHPLTTSLLHRRDGGWVAYDA